MKYQCVSIVPSEAYFYPLVKGGGEALWEDSEDMTVKARGHIPQAPHSHFRSLAFTFCFSLCTH